MTKCDVASDARPIFRDGSLIFLCIAAFAGWAQPGLLIAGDADDASARKQVWADRVVEQIDQLSNEGDRQFLVGGLAEAGQIRLARALVAEKLPEDKRPQTIMAIAAGQSTHGDVAGALQTLGALPKGSRFRDYSQALVAVRQAQQGNVAVAQRVIIGITDQNSLDRAHEWIAKAQAEAGDRKSAAETADLIRDEDRQRQVRAAIAASAGPESFSFRCIRSPFLSTQVAALSLFSGDESWKTKAFVTLAAAYKKDEKAVASEAEKAITLLDDLPAGVDRATGFAILALAFSEAGRTKQADNAGDEALKAMSGDLVGVSSLFGKPIVIYSLVRLGRYEQIDKILETAERNQDRFAGRSAWGDLGAVGAALAAQREDRRLDEVYQQLQEPINRAYLSLGVLNELSRPPKPDQPEGPAN